MRWIAIGLPVICLIAWILFSLCWPDSDDQGFKDFCGEAKVIQDDFQQFYSLRTRYPAYTMEQLRQLGARSDDEAEHEYWFYFTPFSSETPDNQVVLRMGYGPLGFFPWLCDFSWTKAELTHDPAPDPWKSRLEEAKERKVGQILATNPTAEIKAAMTWFEGYPYPNFKAGLLIEYQLPGTSKPSQLKYDLMQDGKDWTMKPSVSK